MDIPTGGHLRRVACKLCRDRKVKCGGEQPQCLKCKRAGELCIYLPTQRPTKADLAHTVELLQKRLDEAQAYISRLHASPPNKASSTFPHTLDGSTTANNSHTVSPSSADMSSTGHQGHDVDALVDGSDPTDLMFSPQELQLSGPQISDPLVWQALDGEAPLAPFSAGDGMSIDHVGLDLYAHNGFQGQRVTNEETGTAVFGTVRAFSSTVLRSQAEASVMGALIADYIAWLRKVPPGGGGSVNEGPHYVGILETIEARVRELCDANQSKTNSALRDLIKSLEGIAEPGGAMATRLASLEEELQAEAQERAKVFRSRYNICALLTEQARNMS